MKKLPFLVRETFLTLITLIHRHSFLSLVPIIRAINEREKKNRRRNGPRENRAGKETKRRLTRCLSASSLRAKFCPGASSSVKRRLWIRNLLTPIITRNSIVTALIRVVFNRLFRHCLSYVQPIRLDFFKKIANAQRYLKLWRLDHREETNITFYSFVENTNGISRFCGLPSRSNLRSISCTKREINKYFRYLELQSTNTRISRFRFFADIPGISYVFEYFDHLSRSSKEQRLRGLKNSLKIQLHQTVGR